MSSLGDFVTDVVEMTKRNLYHYVRNPRLIILSFVQPVLFLTMFWIVFKGQIEDGGGLWGPDYITWLLPGMLVATVLFGGAQTTVGLAEDRASGIVERFRTLPIARSAWLLGRAFADSTRNLVVLTMIFLIGLLFGFRPETGILSVAAALVLVIIFGFAFSWISATIGLLVGDAETAQVAGFIWMFPLIFLSSIMIPTSTLPGWIQPVADLQPVTIIVNMVRELMLGPPPVPIIDPGEPLLVVAWIVGLVLVFVPLAVYRYRKLA